MDDAVVIGYGVVGKATASVFGIKKYYDIRESNVTLEEAAKCKIIFICVPTPAKDGKYDLTSFNETLEKLSSYGCNGVVINRSTVAPGTVRNASETYKLKMVSNPEFLTEVTADFDAKHPEFIVIGADDNDAAKAVRGLYDSIIKGVNVIETDSLTAEMIKITLNAFFATKVIFANQIYDICEKNGANYETIKNTLYMHKWVGKNHLDIFHKGGRGAKGKCLGKDLEAFAGYSQSELLKLINQINARYPDKQ